TTKPVMTKEIYFQGLKLDNVENIMLENNNQQHQPVRPGAADNPSQARVSISDSSDQNSPNIGGATQNSNPVAKQKQQISYADAIRQGNKFTIDDLPTLNDSQLSELSPNQRDDYMKIYYEKHFLEKLSPVQKNNHLKRMLHTSSEVKNFYYHYLHDQNVMATQFKIKNPIHSNQEIQKILENHLNLKKIENEENIKKIYNNTTQISTSIQNINELLEGNQTTEEIKQLTEKKKSLLIQLEDENKNQIMKVTECKILEIIIFELTGQDIYVATPYLKEIEKEIRLRPYLISLLTEPLQVLPEFLDDSSNPNKLLPVQLFHADHNLDQVVLANFYCNGAYINCWHRLLLEHFPPGNEPNILKYHVHVDKNTSKVFKPFAQ
ncbi:uncharacterized protein J8A68_003978, partial [[Candida] subhashii]